MSDTIAKKDEKYPRLVPAADVIEHEDGFHIHLDMPGVRKEDLVIDVDKDELTITGKTAYAPDPTACDTRSYVHTEFGGGEFRRTFTLSDSVDREKVTAQLKGGVLDLHLPKSEALKPRRISISVG
ncbi:MAG: Hsp20/alpha crystallin family protein [Desulfovibrionaceae bacterium]